MIVDHSMTCPDHISVNHFGQVAQIAVGEGGSRGEHTTFSIQPKPSLFVLKVIT